MITRAAGSWTREHAWAVVLAGGVGSRLRSRTIDDTGHHVPKQYCLVDGQNTLLQLAISRARNLVDPARLIVVVLSQHQEWWRPQLRDALPPENVVTQPTDRGTAVGVLLPLLRVLARDPEAHVVVLPSDHHFRHEERLGRAIRRALEHTFQQPDRLVFVGVKPTAATSDFGYLVPQAAGDIDPRPVESFVEKPPREMAEKLILQRALWNTLIFAGRGRCLLSLIRERFPGEANALRGAAVLAEEPILLSRALEAIYPNLATIDLSKDVLECADCPMAMTQATRVGWSELGTPDRMAGFWEEVHVDEPSETPLLHPP